MKKKLFFAALAFVCILIFCGCSGEKSTPGTAEVELNSKGDKLTVTVLPDESSLSLYDGGRLYLFALEPGKAVYNLNAETPIANKKAGSKVSFSLPLVENGVNRLYYGFTAAFYDTATNSYVEAVSGKAFVGNPEVLAGNTDSFVTQKSIKGICAEYDTEAVELGVSHAIIEIPVERYILPTGSADAVAFTYNRRTGFISAEALKTLDARVKYYTENGVTVYFRFVLNTPQSALPDALKCLSYDGVPEGHSEYALNLGNTTAADMLAGFFDFIADRYTRTDRQNGLVSAFIAGRSLNTPGAGVSGIAYESYLAACSDYLRLLYTALTSHYENGRVYLTVDHHRTTSAGSTCDSPANGFIADFAVKAEQSGDYPWGVAASIRATSTDSDRIWYDNSGDGAYLTPSNLGTLSSDLLNQTTYLYEGEPRSVIVSDFSVAVTENPSASANQAASYAYAYYKAASAGNVDAFFYSHQVDKASGLRTADDEGVPGEARRIYGVFRNIDTDADINAEVSATIADSNWTNLYSAYSGTVQVKQSCTGDSGVVDPATYSTSVLFNFANGTANGFSTKGDGSFYGLVRNGDSASLEASLPQKTAASPSYIVCTGIEKSDINGDSFLVTVSVGADAGATGSSAYAVTLTLIQKNEKSADVYYEAVSPTISAGSTQTLFYDISGFRDRLGKGEITLRLTAESTDGTGCTLRLDEILTGKAKSNTWIIVLLIVLASTALVAVFVLVGFWFRKNYRVEFVRGKNKGGKERPNTPKTDSSKQPVKSTPPKTDNTGKR